MLAMSWGQWFLGMVVVFTCLLLILVILIQRGRGGGLVGAFGGATSSAFGTKTGDVFTWITVGLAGFFVFLAVMGNYAFDESKSPAMPPIPSATAPPTLPDGGVNVLPAPPGETAPPADIQPGTANDSALPVEGGAAPNETGLIPKPDSPAPPEQSDSAQPETQPAPEPGSPGTTP